MELPDYLCRQIAQGGIQCVPYEVIDTFSGQVGLTQAVGKQCGTQFVDDVRQRFA